jgi:pilus assembly protein Flp/PilA
MSLHTFLHNEEGQTLVEYGLLISLIALVVITSLTIMGKRLKSGFNAAATSINTTT